MIMSILVNVWNIVYMNVMIIKGIQISMSVKQCDYIINSNWQIMLDRLPFEI